MQTRDADTISVTSLEEMFDVSPAGKVIVQAYLGHLSQYGRDPMLDLVYWWKGGKLREGDLVLCPKTPLGTAPFKAIVVSLDGNSHPYKGPCKKIIKRLDS